MTSARRETEFEAQGLYAVSAPRLENALPRCAFPEAWHCPQSGNEDGERGCGSAGCDDAREEPPPAAKRSFPTDWHSQTLSLGTGAVGGTWTGWGARVGGETAECGYKSLSQRYLRSSA